MHKPKIISYKTLRSNGEINTKYSEAIESLGGELFMFESCEEIDKYIDQADGILLPGGHDVNPILYGEEISYSQPSNDERDRFEMLLIEKAMERKLPILGICRGLQILNVKFGGSLYQDVEKEMEGSIRHDMHEENSKPLPRSLLTHDVSIVKGIYLHSLIGVDMVKVNSLHHQGIKKLGNGLIATSHSKDGLVESIEFKDYPYLVGVQWHPEELMEIDIWRNFMTDFIKVCSK